jgi:hypothetical protein
MYASFNRFEIEMTKEQAHDASHSGSCDNDVAELLTNPKVKRQLKKIPDDLLAAELREFGAWDETELADRKENEARIIWIAAGNITEMEWEKRKGKS